MFRSIKLLNFLVQDNRKLFSFLFFSAFIPFFLLGFDVGTDISPTFLLVYLLVLLSSPQYSSFIFVTVSVGFLLVGRIYNVALLVFLSQIFMFLIAVFLLKKIKIAKWIFISFSFVVVIICLCQFFDVLPMGRTSKGRFTGPFVEPNVLFFYLAIITCAAIKNISRYWIRVVIFCGAFGFSSFISFSASNIFIWLLVFAIALKFDLNQRWLSITLILLFFFIFFGVGIYSESLVPIWNKVIVYLGQSFSMRVTNFLVSVYSTWPFGSWGFVDIVATRDKFVALSSDMPRLNSSGSAIFMHPINAWIWFFGTFSVGLQFVLTYSTNFHLNIRKVHSGFTIFFMLSLCGISYANPLFALAYLIVLDEEVFGR